MIKKKVRQGIIYDYDTVTKLFYNTSTNKWVKNPLQKTGSSVSNRTYTREELEALEALNTGKDLELLSTASIRSLISNTFRSIDCPDVISAIKEIPTLTQGPIEIGERINVLLTTISHSKSKSGYAHLKQKTLYGILGQKHCYSILEILVEHGIIERTHSTHGSEFSKKSNLTFMPESVKNGLIENFELIQPETASNLFSAYSITDKGELGREYKFISTKRLAKSVLRLHAEENDVIRRYYNNARFSFNITKEKFIEVYEERFVAECFIDKKLKGAKLQLRNLNRQLKDAKIDSIDYIFVETSISTLKETVSLFKSLAGTKLTNYQVSIIKEIYLDECLGLWEQIERWNNTEVIARYHQISTDDFGNRTHSIFTRMPGWLRRDYLSLDNKSVELTEFDLDQCQITILSWLLSEFVPGHKLEQDLKNGIDVYSRLWTEKYGTTATPAQRESMKREIFKAIYSGASYHGVIPDQSSITNLVGKECADIIFQIKTTDFKQLPWSTISDEDIRHAMFGLGKSSNDSDRETRNNKNLVAMLQRAESFLFDEVERNVQTVKNPVLRIHDAIYATDKNKEQIIKQFKRSFNKYLSTTPWKVEGVNYTKGDK